MQENDELLSIISNEAEKIPFNQGKIFLILIFLISFYKKIIFNFILKITKKIVFLILCN